MSNLVPENKDIVQSGPVFENVTDAFSFWEKKVEALFEELGDEIEVDDFVSWATKEKCPPIVAYIALKDTDDPVGAFDALKNICISNVGVEAAAAFFSDYVNTDINACDRDKDAAFRRKPAAPPAVVEPEVPRVSDVYFRIDAWLAEGEKGSAEYDLAIEALRQSYCPSNEPHNEALRYRGIGEVLERKGDYSGALSSYEIAVSIYSAVGVKKRIKELRRRLSL